MKLQSLAVVLCLYILLVSVLCDADTKPKRKNKSKKGGKGKKHAHLVRKLSQLLPPHTASKLERDEALRNGLSFLTLTERANVKGSQVKSIGRHDEPDASVQHSNVDGDVLEQAAKDLTAAETHNSAEGDLQATDAEARNNAEGDLQATDAETHINAESDLETVNAETPNSPEGNLQATDAALKLTKNQLQVLSANTADVLRTLTEGAGNVQEQPGLESALTERTEFEALEAETKEQIAKLESLRQSLMSEARALLNKREESIKQRAAVHSINASS